MHAGEAAIRSVKRSYAEIQIRITQAVRALGAAAAQLCLCRAARDAMLISGGPRNNAGSSCVMTADEHLLLVKPHLASCCAHLRIIQEIVVQL